MTRNATIIRGILGAAIAAGLLAPLTAHAAPNPEDDRKICAQASGDVAIAACNRAIASRKFAARELATIYNNRGWEYFQKREFDRAIADYNEAIKLDPKYAAAYNNRGVAWHAKGDLDRAIADYDETIKLDPKNATFFNSRCWARATAGRELQQALADCDQSLRLRPDDAGTLDSRGLVYLRLARLDDAVADYDAALKIDPKLAGSLYGRGIARLRKGDAAGGKADIAAAVAIRAGIAEEFKRYGVTP